MRVKFSPELPLIFALVSCVFLLPTDVSGQSSQNSSPACLYFVTQQSCPPCRQMDPVIARLVSQGYPVKTVHLETNRAWAQWANVQRTPTVIMLDSDDRIMKRFFRGYRWRCIAGLVRKCRCKPCGSEAESVAKRLGAAF